MVGNVVLRIVGRLAVLTDVGAQIGPIARVARPHPVVGLTAEIADAERRRVNQAHVADFHLRRSQVLRSLEE